MKHQTVVLNVASQVTPNSRSVLLTGSDNGAVKIAETAEVVNANDLYRSGVFV
jgi:hypothetical protein